MGKVKADIQKIADDDPVMAQLLELSTGFMYKDWQLFRQGNAMELAARIRKRMRRATWFLIAMMLWFLGAFAFETFSSFGAEDGWTAMFRVAMAVASFAAIIFSQKQQQKVDGLIDTLQLEAHNEA